MIKIIKQAYQVGEVLCSSIEDAQVAELSALIPDPEMGHAAFVQWLVQHKDEVIDVLTTTANSRPRARRIHGGSKTRKAANTDATTSAMGEAPQTI